MNFSTTAPADPRLSDSRGAIAGPVDEYIRSETLRVVFQQASLAPLLSELAAILVVIGLWGVTPHSTLLFWLGGISVVSLMRVAVIVAYRRWPRLIDRMIGWEHAFVYTLVGVSLVWGIGAWTILPHSVTHEVLVYFIIICIAGVTVASYSAHPTACLLALTSLVVPMTVWFAWHDVLELRLMALGGAMYLVAATRAAHNYGKFWRRSLRLSWDLDEQHVYAEKLARTDELTGLYNRRAFMDLGRQALEHARRYRRRLTLVMFDIDRFKAINDTFGHAAGDQVLRAIGAAINRAARMPDIPGRLGGEEFAVLLPETDGREAVSFAERLRADVAALAVAHDGVTIRFTCSVGVATRGEQVSTLDTLLKRADAAMYRAKREGRNRVLTGSEGEAQ